MDIGNLVYQKFDLSQQAIVVPSVGIKCLYFEKWGIIFLDAIFREFFDSLSDNSTFLYTNGYRSNLLRENFTEISKNAIYSIEHSDVQGLGIILTDENLNWIIHRDPDYGTISFAYDDKISGGIINKLKGSKYFIDDKPRDAFYTDEL